MAGDMKEVYLLLPGALTNVMFSSRGKRCCKMCAQIFAILPAASAGVSIVEEESAGSGEDGRGSKASRGKSTWELLGMRDGPQRGQGGTE